jgi:hypothetical protein
MDNNAAFKFVQVDSALGAAHTGIAIASAWLRQREKTPLLFQPFSHDLQR